MTANFIPGPRDFAAYLYKIRYCVFAVVALMLFSFTLGAAFAITMPGEAMQVMKLISTQFGDLKDQAAFDLMVSLFLHNALICALMAVLGLALGIITLLLVFDNGLMIGLIGTVAAGRSGLPVTLAALLPHGIVEIPAMALSAAIGLYLGYCILLSLFGRRMNVTHEILDSARMFVAWILPMLLVAAFLESFVTTALVNFLTH
jgi:stage II sporulation protein M